MKIIFKIVEHLPETNQILVKFARQNAPKPIDEYYPVAIDLDNLVLNDYDLFTSGLLRHGIGIITSQEEQEPTLDENKGENVEDFSIENLIGKVICDDVDNIQRTTYRLNKVNLELL
jgi:hypothetical protein